MRVRPISKKEATRRAALAAVLRERQLPQIFSFSELSEHLEVDPKSLAAIVNATPAFYREFTIAKRSGGERTLSAPFPSLAGIQRWIAVNILSKADLHECAVAYRQGRSIKDHVAVHVNQRELLKLDVADFFPSTTRGRVEEVLVGLGYSYSVTQHLARLLTLGGSVPQGAPSSPQLSNVVNVELDERLCGLSTQNGLKYTRYADDFAFSGDQIPLGFVGGVAEVLSGYGYELNHRKTRLYSESEAQRSLTGLSLYGPRIRPARKFRRSVREQTYLLSKFGLNDLDSSSSLGLSRLLSDIYALDSLKGKVQYWLWIDANDPEAVKASEAILKFERGLTEFSQGEAWK